MIFCFNERKGRQKLIDAINSTLQADPETASISTYDVETSPEELGAEIEYFTLQDHNALFPHPILNAISNAGFVHDPNGADSQHDPDSPQLELIDVARLTQSTTNYTFRDHNYSRPNN